MTIEGLPSIEANIPVVDATGAPDQPGGDCIPVDRLAAFVQAEEQVLDAALAELAANRPDRFSPPAEITAQAGRVGELAGRRELLDRLSEFLGATGVITMPRPYTQSDE